MGRRRRATSAETIRRKAERRADGRCEYCHAPQAVTAYRFHLEHVIPASLGGTDDLPNRALACATCNLAKSDKIAEVDQDTGRKVALFNPRTQVWEDHFRWKNRTTVVGITPEGRATVVALDMNGELRKRARRLWFVTGWLP